MTSFKISLPLMCNGNKDNGFDELCETKFPLIIFLCFYFHDTTYQYKSVVS